MVFAMYLHAIKTDAESTKNMVSALVNRHGSVLIGSAAVVDVVMNAFIHVGKCATTSLLPQTRAIMRATMLSHVSNVLTNASGVSQSNEFLNKNALWNHPAMSQHVHKATQADPAVLKSGPQ